MKNNTENNTCGNDNKNGIDTDGKIPLIRLKLIFIIHNCSFSFFSKSKSRTLPIIEDFQKNTRLSEEKNKIYSFIF